MRPETASLITDGLLGQRTTSKIVESMRQAFQARVEKAPKYKSGVEIPRSPRHAPLLDRANGNNLWEESTRKEFDSLNERETSRVLENWESLSME